MSGPILIKKDNNQNLLLAIIVAIITLIYLFSIAVKNDMSKAKLDEKEEKIEENFISYAEIQNPNNDIKHYLGDKVIGTDVKELIIYIKKHNKEQYNNNEDNYIRLLIHLDTNYTKNRKSYYLLTGTSPNIVKSEDYLSEYIDSIKSEEYYYVNIHEYNSNGSVYSIVISDNINKFRYQ